MAGLAKVPPLEMSPRQYELLEKASREYKRGHQEVKRIKILLKGSKGQSNYSIGKDLGITVKTVENWRMRWGEGHASLQAYEKGNSGLGVKDSSLLEELLKRVKDRPRSGKPQEISLSARQQIATLACRKPSEYGIPITDWTLSKLAEVAIREKIVKSISAGYVGEILKKSGDPSP